MSFRAKRELLVQVAPRYRAARHGQRSVILDEFVAVTGYERKYAIRLLLGPIRPPAPIRRPRAPHYGPDVLWDGKTVSVRGSAMLSTCSSFCDSYSRPWSPQYARGTTSSSRTCCCASTGGADAPNSHAAPSQVARAGQTAVDPGSSIVRGLARVSDIRHTRYGGALASAGLAPLLALEVSLGRRTPASHSRGAVSNRD